MPDTTVTPPPQTETPALMVDWIVSHGPNAIPRDELLAYARLQDALRADLLAFLEGMLPAKADHAPLEEDDNGRYVQCSENENGHPDGDCPNDIYGDTELYVTAGALRAIIARATGGPS